jgi:hypothetical protein
MESLFTLFLLFIAVLTALLTYLVLPTVPVLGLTMAAAVALAVGIWWHWAQFSTEYRMSTWQEVLRNYASYVMIILAIVLSYGFYVFVWTANGGQVQAAFSKLSSNLSDGLKKGSNSASRSLTSLTESRSSNSARLE